MRVTLLLAGLVTVLATLACQTSASERAGSTADMPPASVAVATPMSPSVAEIVTALFAYQPMSLEVAVGTEVTWRNEDQILHTATSGTPDAPSGLFDGQMEWAGTSFTFRFDEPGRYAFYCSRHLHMRGEVVVQ